MAPYSTTFTHGGVQRAAATCALLRDSCGEYRARRALSEILYLLESGPSHGWPGVFIPGPAIPHARSSGAGPCAPCIICGGIPIWGDFAVIRNRLQIGGDFRAPLLAAKVRRLSRVAVDSRLLIRVLDRRANVNILHPVLPSLPALAAGVHGYLEFCALIQVNPFPPLPPRLCQRGSLFRPGRSFALYLSHLEKACARLGMGCARRTAEVRVVDRGLANIAVVRGRFRNVLEISDIEKFLDRETFRAELGRLGYLAVPPRNTPTVRCHTPLHRRTGGRDASPPPNAEGGAEGIPRLPGSAP